MITEHKLYFRDAAAMAEVADGSINLVATSPPYPMIEMWDELFSSGNPAVGQALGDQNGRLAFDLMHLALDRVWREVDRVVAPGGIVCVNVGDATRTIGGTFRLYPNHVRVSSFFQEAGFDVLPMIVWRKQSNKPNKFMGSGMLPPNAYVTLEHEYVLTFRKREPRQFPPRDERRRRSAFFREERNLWFSDVWTDLKGVSQLLDTGSRDRSAAFPFELPYRLIQMYSVQEDIVLDPFAGTGTTTLAAMASGRSSVGYEIDKALKPVIEERIGKATEIARTATRERLERHRSAIGQNSGSTGRYTARSYSFAVATAQETDISLPLIEEVRNTGQGRYEVVHY